MPATKTALKLLPDELVLDPLVDIPPFLFENDVVAFSVIVSEEVVLKGVLDVGVFVEVVSVSDAIVVEERVRVA